MRLIIEHHRSDVHSFEWHELGLRGHRAELMVRPNFYVRLGAHPYCWELSIDADGWRIFPPIRRNQRAAGVYPTTWGALWPWRR